MNQYLYILSSNQLRTLPSLGDSMFCHRTSQFRDRLQWPVTVDENGHERDEYDDLSPLYLISATSDGIHQGSLRFLPTSGRTMVNEHFSHLLSASLRHQRIWECSRFCLSPNCQNKNVSLQLLLGAWLLAQKYGILGYVGVFDHHMFRSYKRLGWSPEIIGHSQDKGSGTFAGFWKADLFALSSMRFGVQSRDLPKFTWSGGGLAADASRLPYPEVS